MAESEMNGSAGLKWPTIIAWSKWLIAGAIAAITVVCTGFYNTGTIVQEFRSHTVAAEQINENQDQRLDVHETRIDNTEKDVLRLQPLTADREVAHAISMVQSAIECRETISDESGWVFVPSAGSECLADDLRVRVEEHFRALGYEVSRQRESDGKRWLGFWVFVKQANEA